MLASHKFTPQRFVRLRPLWLRCCRQLIPRAAVRVAKLCTKEHINNANMWNAPSVMQWQNLHFLLIHLRQYYAADMCLATRQIPLVKSFSLGGHDASEPNQRFSNLTQDTVYEISIWLVFKCTATIRTPPARNPGGASPNLTCCTIPVGTRWYWV